MQRPAGWSTNGSSTVFGALGVVYAVPNARTSEQPHG